MIRGVGVDLVSVARIAAMAERHGDRFLQRVFQPAELDYCAGRAHRDECLAARFAAKEAVLKCLGTGQADGLTLQQVEVVRDAAGAVSVHLHGASKARAAALGVTTVHLSLSHEQGRAVAFAVVEGPGAGG